MQSDEARPPLFLSPPNTYTLVLAVANGSKHSKPHLILQIRVVMRANHGGVGLTGLLATTVRRWGDTGDNPRGRSQGTERG
jgi:hypothetical protein